MKEYGIYVNNAAGVLEADMYSREEANARLAELSAEYPENAKDLEVVEVYYDEDDGSGPFAV